MVDPTLIGLCEVNVYVILSMKKMPNLTQSMDWNKNLHPWVRVDQAGRSLPPKTLSILVGLTLKLVSLCVHY